MTTANLDSPRRIPGDPSGRAASALLALVLLSNLRAVELTVPFDQDHEGTLGLPGIPAEHVVVFDAAASEFRFSHHPNLAVHDDRLVLMWSSGRLSEDENGQRIMWSSGDGDLRFTPPAVLFEDPDGEGPRCAVATGFHSHQGRLVAYYSAMERIKPAYASTVFARVRRDADSWEAPVAVVEGFFIESPRRLPSGRLLMGGQDARGMTRLLYTDSSDGVNGWRDAPLPPFPDFQHGAGYPEPNWFVRPGGDVVMLFRATRAQPWLYCSVSRDGGQSWTAPERTNLPSATARAAAGNLPDGTAFCIWNPSQKFGRIPLVLALSADGVAFDRAFVIRGGSTRRRFGGERKADGWQYPSAAVWRDSLWIAYSVNKEDVAVSRIRLADLRPKSGSPPP